MMNYEKRHGSLFLIAFLIVLTSLYSCTRQQRDAYPSDSDQAAIDFFFTNKNTFEKLRIMIEQNPFIYLSVEYDDESPPNAFGHVPEVKRALLDLMSELKLRGINGVDSSWGIRLIFLSSGMAMGGSTKSYFYSKEKPNNIVPSTEGFRPNTDDSSSVFRPVESDWYLQLEWGG